MKLLKKVLSALLAFTITTSLAATPLIADSLPSGTASAVRQTKPATLNRVNVSVNNGVATVIPAYNIDGYNYFRLRDIAQKLNYYVGIGAENDIVIATTKAYEGAQEPPAATASKVDVAMNYNSRITYDSSTAIVASFNLEGYNYYRLADLQTAAENTAAVLSLNYNQETNTIQITAQTALEAQQKQTELEAEKAAQAAKEAEQAAAQAAEQAAQAAVQEKSYARQVFELVNEERAKVGVAPLEWSDELAKVAQAHSEDMRARSFFDHTNPDGDSPFDRMKAAGISYGAAGENIASGQRSPETVMNSWMNSEGHRKNILNSSFKKIGVGLSGSVWTQVFSD